MTTYRTEWLCCQSVTETEAWIPARCPFCEPEVDAAVLALARFGAEIARRWWLECDGGVDGFCYRDDIALDFEPASFDPLATGAGVMLNDVDYTPAPGIAEAVRRLTGGDA